MAQPWWIHPQPSAPTVPPVTMGDTGYFAPVDTATSGTPTGSGYGIPGLTSGGGFTDPYTSDLMAWIQSQLGQTSAASDSLGRISGALQGGFTNPYGDEISATLRRVLGEVSGPAYTATEDAARRAQAFTGIEEGRTQGMRRAEQTLAALGHGRRSGTIAQALTDVNKSADQARGTAEQNLTIEGAAKTERNRQMALSITGLMDQIARANDAANASRLGAAAGVESQIANLENQRFGREFQLRSLPVELQDRRLQSAMQLLNGGTNPSSILQALTSLFGQVQTNNLNQQAQNQQFWQGLGNQLGQVDWRKFGLN